MEDKNNPVRSKTTEMQIGNTTYIVTSTFKENARETAEQKLLRLIADHISTEIKSLETGLIVGNLT